MAIAEDATSSAAAFGTSTVTWSHTCTGSNGLLVVGTWDDTGGVSLATGVTYNGVSMTSAGAGIQVPGDRWVRLWWLVGPATGAHNIVASVSGGGTLVNGWATSYTGVKQTGQPDAAEVTNTLSTGTPPVTLATSITTVANNSWTVIVSKSAGGGTLSAGTGSTLRVLATAGGALFDSNAAVTPAGSHSMTVDCAGTNALALLMISFSPAVAATATGIPPALL